MHIEFTKNHGVYSPGDTAGFDPSVAEVLIKKGVAVAKQWSSPAPVVDATPGLGEVQDAGKPARGRRK